MTRETRTDPAAAARRGAWFLAAAILVGWGGCSGGRGGPEERISVDLGGGVTMELARIPPGSFLMGSPQAEEGRTADERQHEVTLTEAFYMGLHEVTQAQWTALMGTNPSQSRGDDLPVEHVSWSDAADFCDRLSKRVGARFRLPTEAEWERACRGGTTGARYGPLDEVAWHSGNCGGRVHPVGGKRANAYGLHDTLGNVFEWCSDWYGEYPMEAAALRDPTGPGSGSGRVLRGGSWRGDPGYCRAACRIERTPSARGGNLGFRVVRAP